MGQNVKPIAHFRKRCNHRIEAFDAIYFPETFASLKCTGISGTPHNFVSKRLNGINRECARSYGPPSYTGLVICFICDYDLRTKPDGKVFIRSCHRKTVVGRVNYDWMQAILRTAHRDVHGAVFDLKSSQTL
ncbi:unnamed protein product [Schistocephalus solidus]|uniref:YqaJ domain-containing protein n=1 Tax=Schistocephalus solidus TaxID=70667 RepID=A0A183SFB9_SCHSO|nr:unnamed protein product [Schistocephalus solidus]